MIRKIFVVLIFICGIGSMAGCSGLMALPTPVPLTAEKPSACLPSQQQPSQVGFPEIQGTMKTDGEMWALLFFDAAHTNEVMKIVWRITGSGKQFTVQARFEDGTVISPTWGPLDHGSSNWERPGYEWGTGFTFPKPGCWIITASRGSTIGEVRLEVLAP